MAECPTGRYLDEIVTASGLTLAHPTEDPGSTIGVPHSLLDWSGSEFDYGEWDALGVGLIGRLEKSWVQYKSWPGTKQASVAEYNAFVETLNSVRKRYFDMRRPWTNNSDKVGGIGWTWGMEIPGYAWDAAEEIGTMTAIIVDAQCLRQRLDEALAAAGGNPDTPGDTGHKPMPEGSMLGKAVFAVGAIAVVGGGIWVMRKVATR